MVDFLDLFDMEAGIGFPRPYDSIGFLEGNIGERVDRWMQDRYGEFESINRVGYNPETGLVEGSTPYYVSLANNPLRMFGLRTATHAEIEYARMLNLMDDSMGLDFMSKYEDSGLVLRGIDGPNASQARTLAEQSGFEGNTLVIPLNLTDIEADGKELVFGLKKFAQVYESNLLNETGHFKTGDIDFQSGLPLRRCEDGDRYLYGAKGGLSRLYLGTGHCLVSNTDNLEGTRNIGRVVVVKP
jgi:hypothetical protein